MESFFNHNVDVEFTKSILVQALRLYQTPHIVIVIRHPLDRWISGVATWCEAFPDHAYDFSQTVGASGTSALLERMVLDDHTEMQRKLLKPILAYPADQLHFFRFPHFEKVFNWFNARYAHHGRTPNLNAHIPSKIRKDVRDFAYQHQERILEFYKDDLELWKRM